MAFTHAREIFENMEAAFNPTAAGGVDAVFQFEITGDDGGSWNVTVKDGACRIEEGAHASPSVTQIRIFS